MERWIIRVRIIMAAVSCSPAVASRRAKYVGKFLVPTLLGVQPRSHFLIESPTPSFFPMAVRDHTQLLQRGGSQSIRSQNFQFSPAAALLNPHCNARRL
jgi:hypothetical protein